MSNSDVNLYTQASPALASLGDLMYLAYQGLCISPTNAGFNTYLAAFDGDQWTSYGPIVVAGNPPFNNLQMQGAGPALAALGDTLYIAYRGMTPPEEIFWASYSAPETTWNNLGPITAYHGEGCSGTSSNLLTNASPGLGALSGALQLIYPATEPLNAINFATYSTNVAQNCWLGLRSLPSTVTSISPAIAWLGSSIHVVYQGPSEKIYWVSWDGTSWKNHGPIVVQNDANLYTASSPTLAALGNTLYIAYQGISPENEIYWASYSGSGTIWNNLGPVATETKGKLFTPTNPALAAYNGALYLVYQSASTNPNYAIWWAGYSGSGNFWRNNGPINAVLSSST